MAEHIDPDDPIAQMSWQSRLKRFAKRVVNARYLFIAILIHILALAIFGGMVIFGAIMDNGDFKSEEVLVATPPGPPPPPPGSPQTEQTVDVSVSAKAPERNVTRIATQKLSAEINIPPPVVPVMVSESFEFKTDDTIREKVAQAESARLAGVRGFLGDGVKGSNGRPGATGRGKQTVAKFSCYVAQYDGGDWNCNFGELVGAQWYGNCIYNLMLQIDRWTQGRIKAELKPEALKPSSREWIDKVKPPFIFMTGHKDFTFSKAEVDNLREYLMLGGALWVDNSLPGYRSRFDLALRRELKKVLPDREFEAIDKNHPVFREFFNLQGPPSGINHYAEPVEVIKIGGEVAVFYTLNAYSDLWETGLTAEDKINTEYVWLAASKKIIYYWGHYDGNNLDAYKFFRNVNLESVMDSYRFGINITVHLLTRYQDKFKTLSSSGN